MFQFQLHRIFYVVLSLLFVSCAFSQEVYSKSYGSPEDTPIVFLHGGPGFSSLNFELTTAEALADLGYFVIVYDRRGEGRSAELQAQYTFKETLEDIDYVLTTYKIQKANFIAHSFGGVIATYYAKNKADCVNSIIYVSAPISYPNILEGTLASVKKIYEDSGDVVNQNYVRFIEKMDPNSLAYSSYILMHAMANKFYLPKQISPQARELYGSLYANSLYQQYSAKPDFESPLGFWKNEKYTSIDFGDDILNLKGCVKLYGIYGQDDGVLPRKEVARLAKSIGEDNVVLLENGSHNIFIDQQDAFFKQLQIWLK